MSAETVQTYGCDRCGKPKSEHEGDKLMCPNPSNRQHWYSTWRDSLRWADDGHKLTAVLSYGTVSPKLVHPEAGCKGAFCGCQGEEYIERDPDPKCGNCEGTGNDPAIPCWLQHVVDELGSEFFEQTEWRPEIPLGAPVPILYYGDWDTFEWRPRDAA